MKRFPYFCCLALLFLLAACNRLATPPSPEAAVRYNESIVRHCDSVTRAFDVLLESIDARDSAKAARRLELAIMASTRAEASLGKLQDHMGDTQLRDAALALVTYYHRSLSGDFTEILPYMLQDTLEEDAALHVDSVMTQFGQMEDSLFSRMIRTQVDFSKKHGLTLQ
jgi:hypothetical protein